MNENHLILPENDIQADFALLKQQNKTLFEEILYLREQVKFLTNALFAPKSDKKPLSVKNTLQPQLPLDEFEAEETKSEEKPEEKLVLKVKEHTRKKPGRRKIPANLPRVDVVHDIPENEKTCKCCNATLSKIGEETSERLDFVPAICRVIRNTRYKYACKNCNGVEDPEGAVKIAALPPQIIPQGIVTPGLLAHIIIAKFLDSIPLYRQEKQFKRQDIHISRGTMCKWVLQVAAFCESFVGLMLNEVLKGKYLGMDESPVQVLNEPERANTAKSYMWVCRGGDPDHPTVIYRYYTTRSSSVPKELLKNYNGYLQTDGYSGYKFVEGRAGIVHSGCMAHVRRKFIEVVKISSKNGVAQEAVEFISRLYAVERKAHNEQLTGDECKALRLKESEPVLNEFKLFLEKNKKKVPPKSLLGRAINYTLNIWKELNVYLQDGNLRIDNNLLENAIRILALGRKNWLFAGSPRGANALAIMYSIIETAKANNLEPYSYLRYLFTNLPSATTDEDKKALFPQNVDPEKVKSCMISL